MDFANRTGMAGDINRREKARNTPIELYQFIVAPNGIVSGR
jgi:hypothetical protein